MFKGFTVAWQGQTSGVLKYEVEVCSLVLSGTVRALRRPRAPRATVWEACTPPSNLCLSNCSCSPTLRPCLSPSLRVRSCVLLVRFGVIMPPNSLPFCEGTGPRCVIQLQHHCPVLLGSGRVARNLHNALKFWKQGPNGLSWAQ